MRSFRSTFRSHWWLAALVLLAALLLRVVVPAGFMPVPGGHGFTLVPCSGSGPLQLPSMSPHGAPGAHQPEALHGHGSSTAHLPMKHADGHGEAQAQSGCAYADLAVPFIGGADPIQLLAAILLIVATALFFRAALPQSRAPRLRPPLRAPPLHA